MKDSKELFFHIALGLVSSIGSINAKRLIAYTGSAEAVFNESKANLEKIPGIGEYLSKQILSSDTLSRAEEELSFIEQNDISTMHYSESSYPFRLKECEDGPLVLFYKGDLELDQSKIVSIVGTRSPSNYGKEVVRTLVDELVHRGHYPIVVSGLAYGIDILAHKQSLEKGLKTIAVLAHGLDRIYPFDHKKVALEMIERGGLMTEFISKTNPDPQNFVKRNRIIAGLSDATIVVESGMKGGSLLTADIANSYNRDVFAFPGRVSDVTSKGCNSLIANNKAHVIRGVRDLERIMNWDLGRISKRHSQQKLWSTLDEDGKTIINLLKSTDEKFIDDLAYAAQLSVSQINAKLLEMEFAGLLEILPGKMVRLVK